MKNKKIIITFCVLFSVFFLILTALFLSPSYINASENNDELSLKLFTENYEDKIKNIIAENTGSFIEYIDYSAGNSNEGTLEDYYRSININDNFLENFLKECLLTDIEHLSFPAIEINGIDYFQAAVNELQSSMEIISEYLLDYVKNILINAAGVQTEIYSKNMNSYISWYFSFNTGVDRTITNIIGFFTGEKSPEETFYTVNFNRIINDGADLNLIINDDMIIINNVINEIYNGYFTLLKYFSINDSLINPDTAMTEETFINPFINNIVLYFEQVFETMEKSDYFLYQDYTNNDRAVLHRQLSGRITENQKNKIDIINDPFNFLFNMLAPGSVLFVDNYFAGLSTYQHYGIYIGEGKIIHFAPLEGQEISFENGIIHITTLEKFLNGRALRIDMNIEKKFSEQEIITRAMSRLNEKGYNLFVNNCEHFARWCVSGESVCYQVDNMPQKLDDTILIINDNINKISKFLDLFS